MMKGIVILAGLALATAQRGRCFIGGDPHIRGFDQRRGWTHHAIFAPGAWWLVNTESGDFQVQGMYGQCGRRGKGWARFNRKANDSAHCLESVALTSSAVDHKSLVIQPPCTWNWGNASCNDCTQDRLPRVVFNGQKATCVTNRWTELAPGLVVHCRRNRAQVKSFRKGAPPVTMVLSFWAGRGFEPRDRKVKTCTAGTHASMHLWMNRNQFGPQCGHCGDFDGNTSDDRIYDRRGIMTKSRRALCDADVKDCQSLFLSSHTPTRYNSNGHIIPDDDELCGCAPENACKKEDETRVDVQQACAASYEKVCKEKASPLQEEHKDFFEECLEDVCNGGTAFTEVDVGDESEAECSETESMEDDAVCNHCARAAPSPVKDGLIVSGAGYADANGVYLLDGMLNEKKRWANGQGCAIIYYPSHWGWGIGCHGHHRYYAATCDGDDPLACNGKLLVRTEREKGREGWSGKAPVPTIALAQAS